MTLIRDGPSSNIPRSVLPQRRLGGVHAAVPSAWTEADDFDAETSAKNVRRLINAGVDGLYTTGTDGEGDVDEVS